MGNIDLMDLPDDLFCSQILTRLPLIEAVRFSAVSRKSCRGWTQLPHLKFCDEFFDSICTNPRKRKAASRLTRQNMAADIIDKIIRMQCVSLETFELCNCDWFDSSIHKWLLSISLSGVKCVDLKCSGFGFHGFLYQKEVSESIFSCVTLTSLSLKNFKMTKVPPLFQGFPQLETLYLEHVMLGEEAFEAILKLCCLLQSLTVSQCGLPSHFRVISSSLKSFALLRLGGHHCLMEANCPRLEHIRFIQCYCLEMVNICLPVCVHLETDFPLLQHFATVKSLKKITCFDDPSFHPPKVLQSFPHLEELCIDYPLFLSYPNLIAELTLQLANLKTFTVNIGSYDIDYAIHDKLYYMAFMFCSCVLEGSPMLETVRIFMDYRSEEFGHYEFDVAHQIVNDFRSFSRGFPQIKISVSRRIVSTGRR